MNNGLSSEPPKGALLRNGHTGLYIDVVGKDGPPFRNGGAELIMKSSEDKPFRLTALFDWQKAALAKWTDAGRKGIIEAVTGSGKTHVGIGAIASLAAQDPRLDILVVVHSIELMNQWHERLCGAFPGKRVARVGGGHDEDYSITPVACVGVINSVLPRLSKLFAHHARGSWRRFLVADECHHYIDAPVFGKLRDHPFDHTLGLSATIDPYEVDGLGRIVFSYGFQDAHRDGLVPPFDLVNIGVDLTVAEREEYLRLTKAVKEQFSHVFDLYDTELQGVPDYRLFAKLKQIMNRGGSEDPIIKRLFLLLFKRAAICYTAAEKMGLAQRITRLLVDHGSKKLVVFFERIESAEVAADDIGVKCARELQASIIDGDAIWCKVYHSGLNRRERDGILGEFKQIGPSALLACRSLDEGVDIPTVDAALLAASTQSKRQRIQRIGRTLRRGDGTKRPIVITIYARGTSDENVCSEDMRDFDGVATIHEATARSCIPLIGSLLAKGGVKA